MNRHLWFLIAALLPASVTAQDLAITGVSVVDVERGRVIPNQSVLIRDGRISAVVPSPQARFGSGARTIDGAGKYLIPGLWDMHAHIHGSGNPAAVELPLFVAHGARFLGRTAEFGTVEAGRAADLVLLDGNPLDDIRNARRISAVFLGGRHLDRAKLDSMLAAVETAIRPDAQIRPPQSVSAYFPPRGEWARKAPAEVGLRPELVDSAVALAKASESNADRDLEKAHWASAFGREPFPEPLGDFKPRGDQGGIVIRNGYMVAEWGEPERVDLTYSVTKSFLSTTAGLAWDRKLIPDLDAKVKELITTGEFDSPHNAKITWDHLLRQTSDWEGTLWSKPDWSDRPPANTPIEEYKARVRNEPGTVYKYNDVRVNMLGLALLKVWKRPLPDVLRELVMDPIGASHTWEWHGYRNSTVEIDGKPMLSVGGGAHWGGGMWISARDQARFGLFTLHRGVWNGRRILSDEWFTKALTPTGPQPTYGFMNFFLNTGKRQWPSAPESTFCHLGNGTNAVCVLPDYDMVVVLRWIRGNAVDGVLKRLIDSARPVP